MKVVDPGHVYELEWLDGRPAWGPGGGSHAVDGSFQENRLIFVKREGPGYPGNVGHWPGTNIQEVLRALIDRVKYLDGQIPDRRNGAVVDDLRSALWRLEHRAAERHGRKAPSRHVIQSIELEPTCRKCGHIGCDGACHP